MTAIANAVHFNSYTGTSGSIQSPQAEAIRPYSRKPYEAARERFYMLEAFKDGVIDGQCYTLDSARTEAVNREYDKRLATLNSFYLKALKADRSLIYLGDAPLSIHTPSARDKVVESGVAVSISPNPANRTSVISFKLEMRSQVSVQIYTANGALVSGLFTGSMEKGTHTLTWNGIDNLNKTDMTGDYLVKVTANGRTFTRKFLRIK